MTLAELDPVSCILPEEPDCIAIIPDYPTLILIGSYSLKEDGTKSGTLYMLPNTWLIDEPYLPVLSFPFGIYEMHFHPTDTELLGIATSNGEILLYDVFKQEQNSSGYLGASFKSNGRVLVEPPSDNGTRTIITQFQFIEIHSAEETGGRYVLILATTQSGNTKLIKVGLNPKTFHDQGELQLEAQIIDIHRQAFGMEAWTVATIQDPETSQVLVLSGGDDARLLISRFEPPQEPLQSLDLDLVTPEQLLVDKHTHTAGIVTINSDLIVNSVVSTGQVYPQQFILTGSYDESLRVFTLTPQSPLTPRPILTLIGELKMEGAPWRIESIGACPRGSGVQHTFLIAGHTGGVFIVRLLIQCTEGHEPASPMTWQCDFEIDTTFREHESLVYAATSIGLRDPPTHHRILSASFYDKKVCSWGWIDSQQSEEQENILGKGEGQED